MIRVYLLEEEIMIKGKNYLVSGSVNIEKESNYGADSDGNRGVSVTYVDDYDLVIRNMEKLDGDVSEDERESILDYVHNNWENYL